MKFRFFKSEFSDLTFAYVKYVIILDFQIVVSFVFNHEYSRVKHLVAFQNPSFPKYLQMAKSQKILKNYQVQVHNKNLVF